MQVSKPSPGAQASGRKARGQVQVCTPALPLTLTEGRARMPPVCPRTALCRRGIWPGTLRAGGAGPRAHSAHVRGREGCRVSQRRAFPKQAAEGRGRASLGITERTSWVKGLASWSCGCLICKTWARGTHQVQPGFRDARGGLMDQPLVHTSGSHLLRARGSSLGANTGCREVLCAKALP